MVEEKGKGRRWKGFANSVVPRQMVQAFRGMQIQKVIRKNKREIQERIRSIATKASSKVHRVSHWVFTLTFAKIAIPLLLIGFLHLLSPHTDIQMGVTAGVLLFSFVFFLGTKDNKGKTKEHLSVDHCLPNNQKLPVDDFYSSVTSSDEGEKRLKLASDLSITIRLYQLLPLNMISMMWGLLTRTRFPAPLDTWAVWVFSIAFGCDRSEAELELSEYKTISDFFTRRLKPGSRKISEESEVVSPADGTVTFSGTVEGDFLQQVKGVHYSLQTFLGSLNTINDQTEISKITQDCLEEYKDKVQEITHNPSTPLQNSSNCLYQMVVYLGPSDYHRFHSPVNWTVLKRRHFPGKLMSVSPSVVKNIPGLFHINERVAFIGKWQHGFFAMVAVGATNVGSIVVNFDTELATNTLRQKHNKTDNLEKVYEEPVSFKKGAEFGHFNFGSTIVLIYEAPIGQKVGSTFNGQRRIRMGQSIEE